MHCSDGRTVYFKQNHTRPAAHPPPNKPPRKKARFLTFTRTFLLRCCGGVGAQRFASLAYLTKGIRACLVLGSGAAAAAERGAEVKQGAENGKRAPRAATAGGVSRRAGRSTRAAPRSPGQASPRKDGPKSKCTNRRAGATRCTYFIHYYYYY